LNTLFLKNIDRHLGSLLIHFLPRSRNKQQALPSAPRFLFIRPGGIGDAVLLIPTIQHLKSIFPDSRIDIVAENRNSAIFGLCSSVDKVYRYDRLGEFFTCMAKRYDCLIDTEQHHRLSAVTARIIHSNYTIGFSGNNRGKMCRSRYVVIFCNERTPG